MTAPNETTRSPGSDVVRALLRVRRALLADVEREPRDGGERLLVRSNLTGTMQLYELVDSELVALTALPEPVGSAHYIPGSRRALLAIDTGGNERHQLYLLDLAAAAAAASAVSSLDGLTPVTDDARFGHHVAGVSPDGEWIAYVSNRANGVDFDLWLYELATGEHRLCHAGGTWLQPASGFSPDGRYVSLHRPGPRPLDLDLVLVEVATGTAHVPLPHPDEAALVGPPSWVSDSAFYASSDIGRDFAAVVHHDLATGTTTPVAETGEGCDADVVASRDGAVVVVIENRDGAHVIWRLDTAGNARGAEIALPEPGVVESYVFGPPILSGDGERLYHTLSTPRLAGDVFVHGLADGDSRRLTHSPSELAPGALVAPELHQVESFDGERVPFFLFRPRSAQPRPPVVVDVHGGPEAQSMQSFDPVIQALAASGFAVVVPNVRGSTGYGKRYAGLDDTTKRLDSVRDLAAVHGALGPVGLDPDHAALFGGSYGGYMVLAGLAFQPELWAAGVDIVGISHLVSFLEHTSEYRRAHREREYGSLAHDRDFLIEASPLHRVDAIRAPLFVIHGRNDPRVPLSEAEQLVANLRGRGVPCELNVYDDEGHGLARLANQLDAYPRAIAFLSTALAASEG